MNTFLPLLAVAVFAFVVLSGGKPFSAPKMQYASAYQQQAGKAPVQLAYHMPDKQPAYISQSRKKKKSPNDDFTHLNR